MAILGSWPFADLPRPSWLQFHSVMILPTTGFLFIYFLQYSNRQQNSGITLFACFASLLKNRKKLLDVQEAGSLSATVCYSVVPSSLTGIYVIILSHFYFPSGFFLVTLPFFVSCPSVLLEDQRQLIVIDRIVSNFRQHYYYYYYYYYY